jgi:glycosyltransferase involved in cell wall biosynthesis
MNSFSQGFDPNKGLRIAIVHDALVNMGGAERTLAYMSEIFPDAPIFTSVYLPERTYPEFGIRQVNILPGARRVFDERRTKQLFFLWVMGFQRLNLSAFDVVLSSTTFAAKYIHHSRHLCYCYAPFRWIWKPQSYSLDSLPVSRAWNMSLNLVRPFLRRVDFRAMQQVQHVATSCQNMVREIYECYKREARIIYPPVRLSDYAWDKMAGDYYLTVSRLISHKRIDLAIKACQQLGRKLIVVGDGPELPSLKAISSSQIKFMSRVTDAQLRELYTHCRGVIFPSHEDFGIVPIEAQASGRPVIAYGVGGVLETVIENQTGTFFMEQTVEAVVEAVQRAEKTLFDPYIIRQSMQKFDVEYFKSELLRFVAET